MEVVIKANKCSFPCFDRAVRGAVGNCDANRATNGHPSRSFIPGASVWPFCGSHSLHPPGDGGSFCIPSCHPAALVS